MVGTKGCCSLGWGCGICVGWHPARKDPWTCLGIVGRNLPVHFFSIFWGILFLFFGHACSMWKFPGQGSNSHNSSDLSCFSNDAGSLPYCTTTELPQLVFKRLLNSTFLVNWHFVWSYIAYEFHQNCANKAWNPGEKEDTEKRLKKNEAALGNLCRPYQWNCHTPHFHEEQEDWGGVSVG